MLSLRTHNILDYVGGVVLLFIPAIFGFSDIDAARNAFLFSGLALIGYSLLTRYEYSLWKVIPLGTHMTLDVLNGVFVMLAPWIFAYRNLITTGQEMIHYVAALGVFALVAFTRARGVTGVRTVFSDGERERRAG